MAPPPHRATGAVLTCAAVAAIAALTLRPVVGERQLPLSLCLVCGSVGTVDAILNVLLFVPLGAGLGLLGARYRRVAIVGCLLSLLVELLQLVVVPGRNPSLGDILTNSMGTVLGAVLIAHRHLLLHPAPSLARTLAAGGAAAWLLVQLLGAVAFRAAPATPFYFVQHRPSLRGNYDQFDGELVHASLNGRTLSRGLARSELAVRLSARAAIIGAEVGPPTAPARRIAPIVRVVDGARRTRYLLAQREDALLFERRLLAADLRLRVPIARLDRVFTTDPRGTARTGCAADSTTRVAGRLDDGWLRVHAASGGCSWRTELPLRPTLAWALVLPFSHALGEESSLASALWVGVLVSLWAYWMGRGVRRWELAVLAGLPVLGVGLWGVAIANALPAAGPIEWAGALLGLAVGTAAGRRALARPDVAPVATRAA